MKGWNPWNERGWGEGWRERDETRVLNRLRKEERKESLNTCGHTWTLKRKQKATLVLGRSVKCLNKRAIILTWSQISRVFCLGSVALLISRGSMFIVPSFSPSIFTPHVSHFSLSFVYISHSIFVRGGSNRRCRRHGPRKKLETCTSFAARVEPRFSFICLLLSFSTPSSRML